MDMPLIEQVRSFNRTMTERVGILNEYRNAAHKEIAVMKVTGGAPERVEAVHEEMKAAVERWFDALLGRLGANSPNLPPLSGSQRKH